jgi:hypothetical protein
VKKLTWFKNGGHMKEEEEVFKQQLILMEHTSEVLSPTFS